ncbi:MAG: discoidin domain-containing protein [Ruminococcus sp.]|nr:discoidin domain-containing protein [Ruminococcus sp.]
MKKSTYVFLIIVLILNAFMPLYFAISSADTPSVKETPYDKSEYLYLSDMKYEDDSKSAIAYDKTLNNNNLVLNIGDEEISFRKGIFTDANSSIIYDLTGYNYTYFMAYLGGNSKLNKVKFNIYTSNDKSNWTLRNDEDSKSLTVNNDAIKVKINIKDAKYLKLEALNDNGNIDVIYGDAKLVSDSYQEYTSNLRTVLQYDTYLKDNYEANKVNMSEEYEISLLQREFIKSIGYHNLEYMMNYDRDIEKTVNWIMNDLKSLRMYIAGGLYKDNIKMANSLEILSKIYTKYKSDLNDYTPTTYYNANKDTVTYLNTTYFNKTYGDLYRTMMLSLSLTHAEDVYSWLDEGIISDAVSRYEVYKKLYLSNSLDNKIFESLTVEEMRLVMNNLISDEEIEWLNNYTKSNINETYQFLEYKNNYNYYDKKYYNTSSSEYKKWDDKYSLSAYKIENQGLYPKLWIVLEEGGTTGSISKVGANINGSIGIPSVVVSEPGHTSYLSYNLNNDGAGYWKIENDVSNWSKVGRTDKIASRMLNSWGEYDYATYTNDVRPLSYIILAQDALNEYDKYEKAQELMCLADVFKDDKETLKEIYEDVINLENINFNAWYNLINLYRENNETESNWYDLALKITENYKNYPLPMHDLLRQISDEMTSLEYILKFSNLHEKALREAVSSNKEEVRDVAESLLEVYVKKIAIFNFDGVNANTILLSNRFNEIPNWEYSLDGGNTWISVSENKKKLDNNEIASLTSENGIRIHLTETDYSKENIYTIELKDSEKPQGLYANDLENTVIGVNSLMEWRYQDTTDWISYTDASPDLNGEKTLEVRLKATGDNLASPALTYTFTEEANNINEKYISISNLAIESVSSEATSNNGYAKNAIDGNINTIWHSNLNGQDTNRFIIIKLSEPVALSALEYVPSQDSNNGRIKTGIISVSTDGTNYRELKNVSWSDDANLKKEQFTPTEALYVKIEATSNYGDGRNFITAAMFNLYRDASNDKAPKASIYYNRTELINENVIVRLVNPSTNITITNNNGSDTYTFNKNGEFTFEFTDENGVKGSTTATVNWIDKTVPTAEIEYSVNSLTSNEVVARLTNFSEDITILNNYAEEGNLENGSDIYTFTANGEFTFRFKDKAGNIGTARAYVNWIEKEPSIGDITYDINSKTNKSVVATLKSSDSIVILNNNGNNTYTFSKNGTFKFMYQDIAGNISIAEAKVDWIDNDAIVEDEKETVSLSYVNNHNDRVNDTNNSLNNKNGTLSSLALHTNVIEEESNNYMFLYMIIFVIDLFLSAMFIYFIVEQMQYEKEISSK